MPIQDLLHRIRWTPTSVAASSPLPIYDHIERKLLLVPLHAIEFPPDRPGVSKLTDQEGMLHTIPLHRVRAVSRTAR